MNYITAYALLQSDDFLGKLVIMAAKSKKLSKKSAPLIFAFVVGVGVALFFGIRQITVVQEKAKFEAAAVELSKLQTQMEEKLGKADDIRNEKSCGYSSAKFSKGRLSCSVTTEMLYKNINHDEATKMMSEIALQLGVSYGTERLTEASGFVPKNNDRFNQNFNSTLHLSNKVERCSIDYSYPVTNNQFEKFSALSNENFKVFLHCSEESLAEHYQLRK